MLVYQVLVVDKVETVETVARNMGMSYSAFHSRLNNRTRFSPAEVKRLIELLSDARLLRFFADNTPFVVAERPVVTEDGASIRHAVVKAARESIDIMEHVVDKLEAVHTLDHRDRAAILGEVEEAQGAMASLRLAVERKTQ
jgi:hypothetical protein